MSSNNDEFTITLGESKQGKAFYRTGRMGVADSIEAVQKSGLRQAPPYLFAQGRAIADKNDPVWSVWHDTLAERWTIDARKNYTGLKKGKYVVDIVGGGLFMPRPNAIRKVIDDIQLVNNAFPMSPHDKEMLLGDKSVYVFRNGNLETIKVDNILSYDEFLEASANPEFLKDDPIYVVARRCKDARKNPSYFKSISYQRNNPDLVIPFGGVATLGKMLDQAESFKMSNIGSYHDDYKTDDGGRVVVIGYDIRGISCANYVNYDGCSVGVGDGVAQLSAEGADARKNSVTETTNGIVAPSLEQVLALSKKYVPQACKDDFNQALQELYKK